MKRTTQQGFTILELVISMAIFGVIVLAISQIFASSTKITTFVTNQTVLQQELRNAGNIIVDELQRAIYVYPPCGVYSSAADPDLKAGCLAKDFPALAASQDITKMYVGFSLLDIFSTGTRGQKPDGKYNWLVGDADYPILAMISAPSKPWLPCSKTGEKGGCYAFVAYFAVKRKQVTRGTDTTASYEKFDANSNNENQWVIMEYRRNLDEYINYWKYDDIKDAAVLGVGTFSTDTTTKVTTLNTLNIGNLSIPGIRWSDVGCDVDRTSTSTVQYWVQDTDSTNWSCELDSASKKYVSPTPDPSSANQLSINSIPAIAKGESSPNLLAIFAAKMTATTLWVKTNSAKGTAKILVDNIEPKQFKVDYPAGSVDFRGATEVRLTLQGGLSSGGTKVLFPATPLEFFASPRNIAP
jgi:prepilin-type N-terminal cleavage/methylation domain-containing protein